jgi:hypothetical protein
MTRNPDPDGGEGVSSQAEPAPTPLLSVADLPLEQHPVVSLCDNRRKAVELHAKKIAESARGPPEAHLTGKLGEDAYAGWLGISEELDVTVYPDGGDGGSDLLYNGATIDVKTLTRQNKDKRQLLVNEYSSLSADYYALASRIGPSDFRLIGYAPREFVANAPTVEFSHGTYHVVDPEYLFPFTRGFSIVNYAS